MIIHKYQSAPALLLVASISTPAVASPWWYVDRGATRVLFIDAGSIERHEDIVTYSSKNIIRDPGDPAAMTSDFMRADCGKRQLGRLGIQRFGRDDRVIDTSTSRTAEMMDVPSHSLADSELRFVCSDARDRDKNGQFVLAIDDAAFTDALIAGNSDNLSPRALHDRMRADRSVPVIRSWAADPASFGRVQTVKVGEPLVPPRDYSKGPQIPAPADYDAIEVGRIYDVSYEGIMNGELRFEIRGYSIDDLVHPGSGQTETFPLASKVVNVRDIAITIRSAKPDSLTFSVAIEKQASAAVDPCMPDHCDEEPSIMEATKPSR